MPKIVDIEEQKRRIRKAAVKVFAERGIVGTGLAHVAAEAGMRRPNLYHYYADKDALIQDLADDFLANEADAFRSALSADGDSITVIENLLSLILASSLQHAADANRLVIQFWASAPERVRPHLRAMRGALTERIVVGQKKGEIATDLPARDTATALIALIDGLLAQAAMDDQTVSDVDALCRSTRAMVARILRPATNPA